jgi:hypothetical protein
MINTLTDWVQDKNAPTSSGNGLIGAYGLVYLGMAVSDTLMRFRLLAEQWWCRLFLSYANAISHRQLRLCIGTRLSASLSVFAPD